MSKLATSPEGTEPEGGAGGKTPIIRKITSNWKGFSIAIAVCLIVIVVLMIIGI